MPLEIQLLGQFKVTVDGQVVPSEAWRRQRGAAVVKLLAISPGQRLHREQVMDLFWPELDREASGANLRKALYYARRALGEPRLLEQAGDVLALCPHDELRIDSVAFESAAKAALRDQRASDRPGSAKAAVAEVQAACERAAELYGGELSPDDRYVDWLDEPRKSLHALYRSVLDAGQLWQRLVALDPSDERAQCALMQSALDAGNRGEVIRVFQRLRERLRADFGVGPSANAVALYERALTMSEAIAPSSVAERVRAAIAWALVHMHTSDLDKAERIARETREIAIGAELAREVGECTALLGHIAFRQGRFPELFRDEFANFVTASTHSAPQVFDGHLCLTQFCLCGASGHQQIGAAARELLAMAEHADSDPGRALALLCLGEAELFDGNLNTAERLLDRSEQLHHKTQGTAGRVMALQRLAEVALGRDNKADADKLVQRALAVIDQTWLSPHLWIRLQGVAVQTAASPDAAELLIIEGDRVLAEGNSCHPCSMNFRVAAAIALSEAGELELVARRLDDAERISAMWGGGPWTAALWEARGVLRRAKGEEPGAQAAFSEAACRFNELGRSLEEGRCRARLSPS